MVILFSWYPSAIEHQSVTSSKIFLQHFHDFLFHISVEHDEKPPHSKFDMNRCMEPGQFTLISMGLIRYSCGHILGHHEPIPTKLRVWRFFIMLYRNMEKKNHENAEKILLMTSSLWCSIAMEHHHHVLSCFTTSIPCKRRHRNVTSPHRSLTSPSEPP